MYIKTDFIDEEMTSIDKFRMPDAHHDGVLVSIVPFGANHLLVQSPEWNIGNEFCLRALSQPL